MNRFVAAFVFCATILVSLVLVSGCKPEEDVSRTEVRIGCFPNVTHVQALVARYMARMGENWVRQPDGGWVKAAGKGWFEERMPGHSFVWSTYNAGPSAMEAVFGRSIDVTYVGPSPALNAYGVSQGSEVRVMAGAVNGGAALLVHAGSSMKEGKDFYGKRVATPQLGNTQDVSARAWLRKQGLHLTRNGTGDCRVLPTSNAMQLPLFKQGELDAVWTVEPWVSRLEAEAGAVPLVEDSEVATTVLVGRDAWLKAHPELAAKLIAAHKELTEWVAAHPEEAQRMVADEMKLLTRAKGDEMEKIVRSSWKRLKLTTEVDVPGLRQFVKDAQDAGLLRSRFPDVAGIVYQPDSPR